MNELPQSTQNPLTPPTEKLEGFWILKLCVLCVLCGGIFAACGRKGPPLAPIVYLPRAVTDLAAKRVEEDVVIQFKVPATNTDNSAPADLDRIDIYAHTGPLPAAADFVKYGTLVQSVEIKRPEVRKPEDEKKSESKPEDAAPTATRPEGTEKPAATPAQTPTGVKPYAPELPGAPASPKQSANDPAEAGPKQDAKSAADTPVSPKQSAENLAKAELVEQGWLTSIRETLTAKHRELGPLPPTRAAAAPVTAAAVKVETLETPGTQNFEMPVARYYTVVAVSRSRHRRGPFAGPIRVPLIDPLQPPDSVDTNYTESAISLKWPGQPGDAPTPPAATTAASAATTAASAATTSASAATTSASAATIQGAPSPPPDHRSAPGVPAAHVAPAGDPNQETPGTFEIYTDVETEGTQDAPRPGAAPTSKPQPPPMPRFGYNVYDAAVLAQAREVSQPDGQKPPGAPSKRPAAPPILPLNARLLTAPTFEDPRVEFGTERCYVVRRVEMAGAVAVESAPSPPACVTPVDKFPPAAPKAVTSVASGTAVSLIWDANAEADLAGYLVLRGEAPGDTLAPLTKAPITDTSYVDTSVRRNRTYVYEVIAVDKTGNQSAVSNRVEEPIR